MPIQSWPLLLCHTACCIRLTKACCLGKLNFMVFQHQHDLCLLAGMNACIQVGKLTEARDLVKDMQQQNIPVDIRVFNILLKGYRRKGAVSAIPGVMQELAKAGLTPCPFTYNTLIDTYVSAGQLTQARQTCAQATAAGTCGLACAFWLLTITALKAASQNAYKCCIGSVCYIDI